MSKDATFSNLQPAKGGAIEGLGRGPARTAQPGATRRWDPWPVSIIAFFGIAIPGFAAFIVFCNQHPADLVAENYYDQEVRYQGQMERVQRAQQSPAPITVSYDRATQAIVIALPESLQASGVSGTIHLYRPSSVKLDRELKLAPDSQGLQKIDARGLAPGLWSVRLSWTAQNQQYYKEQKLVIGGSA